MTLPQRLAAPPPGRTTYADVVVIGSGTAAQSGIAAAPRSGAPDIGAVLVPVLDVAMDLRVGRP